MSGRPLVAGKVQPGRAGPRSKSRRRIPHPPTGLARPSCPLSAGEPSWPRAALGIGVEREGVLLGETLRRLEPEMPPGPCGGCPATRRAQQVQALQASLAVGDEVVTTSGLYGTIVALDDTVVTLDAGAGSTLRYDRRAIGMRATEVV